MAGLSGAVFLALIVPLVSAYELMPFFILFMLANPRIQLPVVWVIVFGYFVVDVNFYLLFFF